jgi:P27 family predicted phage terminase small subunit
MRQKKQIREAIEAAKEPPAHLSARSQQLWREIVPSRALSAPRLALLEQALSALDRADQCRAAVTTENLVSITEKTGAVHVHPLLKTEKDARAQFHQIWTTLGLVWAADIDGAVTDDEF